MMAECKYLKRKLSYAYSYSNTEDEDDVTPMKKNKKQLKM
jgi:hypothetical protein